MEGVDWIRTLAISFLLLPFLIFLILLIKYTLRFTIHSIQLFFRSHFTWRSDSQFLDYAYYFDSDQRISKNSAAPSLSCLKLTVKKYEKVVEEEISGCAICLSGIEEGDEVVELSCKHLFHRPCLERWIVHSQATCPLCRNSVLPCETKLKNEYAYEEEEYEDSALPLVAYVKHPWWIW